MYLCVEALDGSGNNQIVFPCLVCFVVLSLGLIFSYNRKVKSFNLCLWGEKNPFPMTVIDLKQRFLSNKKKKLYVCIRRILEEFLIRLLMGKMMGNTFHY